MAGVRWRDGFGGRGLGVEFQPRVGHRSTERPGRQQWTGHVGKNPSAPWADRGRPGDESDERGSADDLQSIDLPPCKRVCLMVAAQGPEHRPGSPRDTHAPKPFGGASGRCRLDETS